MLHRSFKPAKCKTSLKLAVSRIKLLNNKREVQIRQLKRELAQLIESGQIQTARIRVEHVIREEKSSTAYNLIEIYCELIAARLPIIESQKTCPIDLKEAVSSVLYACPRCSDVPELADIKKHLTAKYGKEFVHGAIDLRPDCGVNRMLVEKLSAKTPDGQTKLKVLTAIAEEHNVKWNPDTFSESDPKPPQDLLNGPNAFETASKIHTEAPSGPARPNNHDDMGPPKFQVPPKDNTDSRRSSGYQNFASTGASSDNKTTSSEERSLGARTEHMEHKQSYPRYDNSSSSSSYSGGQPWVMQFKDATSAAQAAAESAERASMAARAAAELSRQHSPRSSKPQSDDSKDESYNKSYGYGPRDELPRVYAGSKLQSDHVDKSAERGSFDGRDSGQEEVSRPSESLVRDVYKKNDEDIREVSLKPTTASADSFQRENEFFDEASRKIRADDHVLKSGANVQDSVKPEEISYERVTRKQSSSVSHHSHSRSRSHSHSSSISDGQEEVSRKKNDATCVEETKTERQSSRASSRSHSSTSGEIHVDIFKRNEHTDDLFVRHTSQMSSEENTARFDDYDSDVDHNKVDLMSYKEQETSSRFSPPSSKASIDILADLTAWSPRKNTDEGQQRSASHFHPSIFSQSAEGSSELSRPDPLPPTAAYDDYDRKSSDSEEDRVKSKMTEVTNLRNIPSVKTVPVSEDRNPEDHVVDFRRKLRQSPVDQPDQEVFNRRQGFRSRPVSEKKFDDEELRADRSRSTITKSTSEEVYDFGKDSELLSDSSSGSSGSELKLGTLTGGLRNKGNRRPLFTTERKQSGNSFGVREKTEDDRSDEQVQPSLYSATVRPSVGPNGGGQKEYGERSSEKESKKTSMRTFARRVDSDDDKLEEEHQQDTRINSPSFNLKSGIEINRKQSVRASRTYFDSDNSDAEERVSKSGSPLNARPGPAFSRRTKNSPPNHGKTRSKPTVLSEESVTCDHRSEDKSYSSGSSFPKTSGRSHSKPGVPLLDRTVSPYGVELESSSSVSSVGESLPKTTIPRVYTKPTVSPSQSELPSRGVESKPSSKSSHVSEALPKAYVPSVEPETSSKKTVGRGYSRTHVPPKESVAQRNSYLSSSNVSEATTKPVTEIKSSMGIRDQRRSIERDSPKANPEPRRSTPVESSKSTTGQQKPKSPPKSAKSKAGEASNHPAVSRETSSKDSASHVHPNLPDSDALTAFFQSLKQPRD